MFLKIMFVLLQILSLELLNDNLKPLFVVFVYAVNMCKETVTCFHNK